MDHLIVPGTIDSLETISEFVTRAADAAGFDEKASYRLHLAVDEIATNIIGHGYGDSETGGVLELWSEIDSDTLTISIEDTGESYDPSHHLRPEDLDMPPDQRREGGLGVYLALQSVDEFLYERMGDRNRHTLTMKR
jgi:serine/threonine-protein kinase RsbW